MACKAAREAGDAGQDTAESACLRPLTGRRGGIHAQPWWSWGHRVAAASHLSSYLCSSSEHWYYSVIH